MPRKKRAPWIKVYGDYTTTPSHAELDDRALWTGVVLMQLIRAGCDARDDREPWALLPNGAPCSLTAIAGRARQTIAIARRGIDLLVGAGTVVIRDDGAYGMPRFWEHQDSRATEDAGEASRKDEARWVYFALAGDRVKIGCSSNPWARVNKLRAEYPDVRLLGKERGGFDREAELHAIFDDLREGDWFNYHGELRSYLVALPSTTVVELQQEVRGQRLESSLRSDTPVVPAGDDCAIPLKLAPPIEPADDSPKPKRAGKAKPRTDYPEGLDEHLLSELKAACQTVGMLGPRKVTDHLRDHLRKLYAALEPTPEDIAHVVAVRRAMTARGESYGFLTWESICVPVNFARWLAAKIDEQPSKPARDVDAPFGRRALTGKAYTSAQDREEWQRVDAANARRQEALRGGG